MAWTLLNSSSGSAAVVFSTNGGSTWTNAFAVSFFDTNLTNAWGNSSRSTSLNLNAGATYLFAVTGWGTFTFTANDTRCFLRVVVVAR
jgi:type II secretory pathway pseudopilin PulG